MKEFLNDIVPFFHGKRLSYVDVGAYEGRTFKDVLESGLHLHEAILIEPNPVSFELLKGNVEGWPEAVGRLDLLNVAASASPGRIKLKASQSMTRVITEEPEESSELDAGQFEVPCRTLTDVARHLTGDGALLLKIDVEGQEKQVLLGAAELLREQRVDVIYVEVGMNPHGGQQCYYRDIDDLLMAHGYRLFRIYEQVFEWMSDSPFLRRVNLAYMSSSFADRHPYRLINELHALKRDLREQRTSLEAARKSLNHVQEALVDERELLARKDALLVEAQSRIESYERELEGLGRMRSAERERTGDPRDREMARLTASRQRLREELRQKSKAFQDMKESWSYRLGRTIADSLESPRGFAALPIRLARLSGRYCLERLFTRERSRAMAHSAASSVGASSGPFFSPSLPKKGEIVWQASKIAETRGHDAALAFVNAHGGSRERISGRLLAANRDIDSEEHWLEHVNVYLERQGVSRLELAPGPGSRFLRLRSHPGRSVSNGPLVSIIMAAHDAAETLEHAARSILNQTWTRLELIVVDDASSDGTWDIMQRLADADERVRLSRNAVNVGPYASKNKALRMARGTFVTGHDADDWAHPERLERHVGKMLSEPEVKASLGYMLRIGEDGRFSNFSKIGKTSDDGARRLASISCMFERETLGRLFGHWDSVRFGADSELIERCRTVLGDRFATYDVLTMFCLDAPGSLTNDPVHGVCKDTGISDARRYYRSQWKLWHEGLDESSCYLGFPQATRSFDAPRAALIGPSDIERVLADMPDAHPAFFAAPMSPAS